MSFGEHFEDQTTKSELKLQCWVDGMSRITGILQFNSGVCKRRSGLEGSEHLFLHGDVYVYDFIKIIRSYSDMKTFPSGSQRHQLYPHNGRKTEGERKGN